METIGSFEAKTHLPQLLERAAGEKNSPSPSTASRWPGWCPLFLPRPSPISGLPSRP